MLVEWSRRFREGIGGEGRWSAGWRALNCSQNAPKRPEGQLASIRLVTGPTETQIGIGGARNSQECGLRPILGRDDQEPRDMLRALKKDLEQILKPQNFCSRSQSRHPEREVDDEKFKVVYLVELHGSLGCFEANIVH